jgi:hypothetical protein
MGGGIDGVTIGSITDWRCVIKYTRNYTQYDDDIDETCHSQKPFDDGYRNIMLVQRRFSPRVKFPTKQYSSKLSGDCHIDFFALQYGNRKPSTFPL